MAFTKKTAAVAEPVAVPSPSSWLQEVPADVSEVVAKKYEAKSQSTDGRKRFRIRSGWYIGQVDTVNIIMNDDRPTARVRIVLQDSESRKFRGRVFVSISPICAVNENGEEYLDSPRKFWGKFSEALGAPKTATAGQILEALEGESFAVEVSEFFSVDTPDCLDAEVMERATRTGRMKAWHFVGGNIEGDEHAKTYMNMGYESQAFLKEVRSL